MEATGKQIEKRKSWIGMIMKRGKFGMEATGKCCREKQNWHYNVGREATGEQWPGIKMGTEKQ